jgi:hypothetical protein
MKRIFLSSVTALTLSTGMALAADVATKKKAPEPPPPSWWETVTITGWLSGGITPNFASPANGVNFGRLFDDRSGTPMFNQAVLTVQRQLDPKATGYDFGFKVQGMVGSDARYTHFLGELDYAIHDRTQLDIVEAYGIVHLPWVTPFSQGGIDVKVGQWVTLNGAEVITAPDNIFYSHSYIFNFGPFKHTGVMTITHATSWLDVYAGVTTGTNTSIGWPGDNNNSPSVAGGVGLNLLDGSLTVLAVTHAGPENPKQTDPLGVGWTNTAVACGCAPSSTWRYYNNITTTWKATENLTFITDMTYNRDDGWNVDPLTGRGRGVESYGVAQYATYKVNDWVKVSGRAEIYRDNNNFFVAAFPGYFDNINLQHGFPAPSTIFAPTPTTYLSFTAGLTLTPEVPKNPYITGLTLRPELRWDTTLNGATPFAGGTKRSTVTFGLDAIVPFTIK